MSVNEFKTGLMAGGLPRSHKRPRPWLDFVLTVALVGIAGELLAGQCAWWLANRADSQGRLACAIQWAAWSHCLSPWDLESGWLVARCARRRGDRDVWTVIVERRAIADPQSTQLVLERELMRIQSGQFDQDGQTQLNRLVMTGLDAGGVAEAFLRGYLVRQDVIQAEVVLTAWETLHPNAVDVTFYRGVVSRSRGDIDQARAAFQSVIVDCPCHELARENLAELLLELRLPCEALPHFLIAIRENPQSIPARVGAARCLRHLGRWTVALESLKDLLSRPLPAPEVLQEAGQIALEMGNYDLAGTRLAEAAKRRTPDRQERLAFATTCALQGNRDEGKSQFEQQARIESLNKRRRDLQVIRLLKPANAETLHQSEFRPNE